MPPEQQVGSSNLSGRTSFSTDIQPLLLDSGQRSSAGLRPLFDSLAFPVGRAVEKRGGALLVLFIALGFFPIKGFNEHNLLVANQTIPRAA